MPRNKGFAGFEDKALSFKAACEAIQKEPVREARRQATAQRTTRPSGTASRRSVAPQPARPAAAAQSQRTGTVWLYALPLLVAALFFLIGYGASHSSGNPRPKTTQSSQTTQKTNTAKPQPAVNQTQKAPAAPAKKSPREEYSQFYAYADKKNALDRKTAQLATDINNYAGNLGSNRSFYDRGRAISNEARQCIQELDGISCPSDQARSHLKELFVLINNRAVAMANAVVYSSQGRDPLSQFAEGRDAAIKYDTVNGDFEAEYNQ